MCQVWQETGRAVKFQNMRSKEKSKKPAKEENSVFPTKVE